MMSVDYQALEGLKQVSAFLDFIQDPSKYQELAARSEKVLTDVRESLGVYSNLEKVKQFETEVKAKLNAREGELMEMKKQLDQARDKFNLEVAEKARVLGKQAEEQSIRERDLRDLKKDLTAQAEAFKGIQEAQDRREADLRVRAQKMAQMESALADKAARVKQILGGE